MLLMPTGVYYKSEGHTSILVKVQTWWPVSKPLDKVLKHFLQIDDCFWHLDFAGIETE